MPTTGPNGQPIPTPEEELAAIAERRRAYQQLIDDNKAYKGSYAEQQNTADINRENAIRGQLKAEAEQQRLATNYGDPNAPGVFVDANGVMRGQGTSLQDTTSALVDPRSQASGAFNWGGRIGGAQADVDRARGLSGQIDQRAAIQADYAQANGARLSQADALGLYNDAARGRGPSAAQAQFQQGLDRSLSGNMALANSARGGSLALAQGRLAAMAGNNQALAASTAQAAQLRAQEQQAAMAGYAGLSGQMRGQDINAAQFNAQMGMQGRALNDARAMGYEDQAFRTQQAQLQAQQARVNAQLQSQGAVTNAQTANAALQAANQAHSEDMTGRYIGIGAGIATGVGGALLASQLGGSGSKAPSTGGTSGGGDENNPGGAGSIATGAGGGSTTGGVNASSYRPGLTGTPGGNVAPVAPPQQQYTAAPRGMRRWP